jgi:hypothetical protein
MAASRVSSRGRPTVLIAARFTMLTPVEKRYGLVS